MKMGYGIIMASPIMIYTEFDPYFRGMNAIHCTVLIAEYDDAG